MSSFRNRYEDEVLLPAVRLSLGARRDCVFFRNAIGIATTENGGKVKYGLGKGTSDLVGFVRPSGRFTVLELKWEDGTVSKEQLAFIAMVNLGGGYGRIIRCVDGDVERALQVANAAVDASIAGAKA